MPRGPDPGKEASAEAVPGLKSIFGSCGKLPARGVYVQAPPHRKKIGKIKRSKKRLQIRFQIEIRICHLDPDLEKRSETRFVKAGGLKAEGKDKKIQKIGARSLSKKGGRMALMPGQKLLWKLSLP